MKTKSKILLGIAGAMAIGFNIMMGIFEAFDRKRSAK